MFGTCNPYSVYPCPCELESTSKKDEITGLPYEKGAADEAKTAYIAMYTKVAGRAKLKRLKERRDEIEREISELEKS